MNKTEMLKEINKLTVDYNSACEELQELITKDYPAPVTQERFIFVSRRIKKAFNDIIDLQAESNNL